MNAPHPQSDALNLLIRPLFHASGYHCQLATDKTKFATGSSHNAAIGQWIITHGPDFGIYINAAANPWDLAVIALGARFLDFELWEELAAQGIPDDQINDVLDQIALLPHVAYWNENADNDDPDAREVKLTYRDTRELPLTAEEAASGAWLTGPYPWPRTCDLPAYS